MQVSASPGSGASARAAALDELRAHACDNAQIAAAAATATALTAASAGRRTPNTQPQSSVQAARLLNHGVGGGRLLAGKGQPVLCLQLLQLALAPARHGSLHRLCGEQEGGAGAGTGGG